MTQGSQTSVPRVAEVLRYAGYGGQELDAQLKDRVAQTCRETADRVRCRWVWEAFPVEKGADGVRLAGSGVELPGQDIARHLEGASEAALLCATAGAEPDRQVRRLARRDLVASVVWDACGTDLVEQAADAAEAEVAAWARRRGLVTGWRFSPGYGDLPLTVQPQVLRALDAERTVGVTLADSLLMVPMKSVTAVVGLFSATAAGRNPAARTRCDGCALGERCGLRAAGTPCWRS